MAQYRTIDEGGVTSPRGFTAAAVAAGIKESGRPDLALVVSEHDCAAAAVFTSNRVAAAPVLIDRETLEQGNTSIRGVVINAGNANACTGAPGLAGARESQRLMAEAIGTRPDQILLMSTGVIGVPLPIDRMRAGITAAIPTLAVSSGLAAAEAIMTTDTRPKHLAIELDLPDSRVVLGGMAKGAGMIHPDMATMLCLITTDAAVSADDLQNALRNAVAVSFNAISVDGDTSTNDTVLLLANGASGVRIADGESRLLFADALNALCYELAMMIVADGEGATKVVTVRVSSAPNVRAARQVANTIATSPLVKTAFAGGDPNWGRILMAAGRSGVDLDQGLLALWIESSGNPPLQLVKEGTPTDYSEADAAQIFAQSSFAVHVDLGLGAAEATVWTTDLTQVYVTINANYRT